MKIAKCNNNKLGLRLLFQKAKPQTRKTSDSRPVARWANGIVDFAAFSSTKRKLSLLSAHHGAAA